MCKQMTSLGCDLGSGRGFQGVERGKRQRGILSWVERLVGVGREKGGAFWEDGTAAAETEGVCGRRTAWAKSSQACGGV